MWDDTPMLVSMISEFVDRHSDGAAARATDGLASLTKDGAASQPTEPAGQDSAVVG